MKIDLRQKLKALFSSLRWLSLALAAILLVVFSHGTAIASTAQHYTELEFPPLKDVTLPEYERYQLDNGLVVYLMPDRELPLVSGTALIRTGARWEPSEKVGLAELTGTVMRVGGTKEHPPDVLNELLEQRAATVETAIGRNSGSAGFNALSEDTEWVFKLFAEVLQTPAFPQDKLDLAKTQLSGAIARRNDDPDDITRREFRKLLYGDTSPYARTVEYDTLTNISRQDLIDFHQTYFRPDNMALGIVGDFQPERMKKLIAETFGDWTQEREQPLPAIPQATQSQPNGIFFVEQPQLTQSYIQMGHIGGLFDSPDYPALSVLNGVLNGFGGRLFNELRSRQGLAYVAYGFWSPQYDYPGIFIAGGQTRSEATVPFIQAVLSELEQIRTAPITPEELAYAKESILNSFVFNFQDSEQVLSRLMRYEYYNYPSDFIFRYQRAVKAVKAQDVQRVANKYLKPEQILTLVVGNPSEIQPPLSTLDSAIKTVDISIPTPPRS